MEARIIELVAWIRQKQLRLGLLRSRLTQRRHRPCQQPTPLRNNQVLRGTLEGCADEGRSCTGASETSEREVLALQKEEGEKDLQKAWDEATESCIQLGEAKILTEQATTDVEASRSRLAELDAVQGRLQEALEELRTTRKAVQGSENRLRVEATPRLARELRYLRQRPEGGEEGQLWTPVTKDRKPKEEPQDPEEELKDLVVQRERLALVLDELKAWISSLRGALKQCRGKWPQEMTSLYTAAITDEEKMAAAFRSDGEVRKSVEECLELFSRLEHLTSQGVVLTASSA
ncbi:uncharacterized protein LOC143030783 isoform X2 [Oratosquilla oratoria]|uniref:uncharacterized protein LOC143030783 isoform X2 n=1 Tax=Oratosquilla oratoria TaxID=337810 RepID=UPI003F75D92C